MNTTGIVRRIDDLGRIVIPKEIRKKCRIKEGDPLEIVGVKETTIIIKKYNPIINYHDYFQEIVDDMKDNNMPSEKILHISRMFEAIEYMMTEETDTKEETNNTDYAPTATKLA